MPELQTNPRWADGWWRYIGGVPTLRSWGPRTTVREEEVAIASGLARWSVVPQDREGDGLFFLFIFFVTNKNAS